MGLKRFAHYFCTNCLNFHICLEFVGVTEVFESYRLLHVLFLTNSVFYVLFTYFDESMGSVGGYEPWRSWNTVDIVLI